MVSAFVRRCAVSCLLSITACTVSEKTWLEVKSQLSVIQERDQRYRSKMDSVGRIEGWQSKAVEQLWENQRKLDSVNLAEVDNIIAKYGYPPKDRVGELSLVPFEVIRHSDDSIMASYLQLIIGAGRNGDLRMDQVASFEDRVQVALRQPQEYGTEIWIEFKKDPKTGERYDSLYLWPVRDLPHIDQKRLGVGLDSLSRHLRHLGIDPAIGYRLRKSQTK
jgi:hypothetical protein